MLHSWYNTAMALHYLDGVEERWDLIKRTAGRLIRELNKIQGLQINPVKNGSNVYDLHLAEEISLKEFTVQLLEKHQISLRPPDITGIIKFKVNQTLLTRDLDAITEAFSKAIETAT
jgi:threonine aldolase